MGLFCRIGLALGVILPGYINAFFKFDGTKTTQSAGALAGIQWSMIWLPIILAFVAMWVMSRYTLTDSDVKQMNEELTAERKANQV